jgi:hypothetical protein
MDLASLLSNPQMLMALLNGAGSMMQASAPSTNPASGSFANALGAGLQGGAKGYLAGDEAQRSLMYMQMMQEAMRRKIAEAAKEKKEGEPGLGYLSQRPPSLSDMLRVPPASPWSLSPYRPGALTSPDLYGWGPYQ